MGRGIRETGGGLRPGMRSVDKSPREARRLGRLSPTNPFANSAELVRNQPRSLDEDTNRDKHLSTQPNSWRAFISRRSLVRVQPPLSANPSKFR